MPLKPDLPYPKSRSDSIRSKDWNDAVDEVIRLDGAKLDRAGDQVAGSLTVKDKLGVAATETPTRAALSVTGKGVGNTVGIFGDGGETGISLVASWPNVGFNSYFNGAWKALAKGFSAIIGQNPSSGELLIYTSATAATAADANTDPQLRMTFKKDGTTNFAGPTNLVKVWTQLISIQMNGNSPGRKTVDFSAAAFKEVYAVLPLFTGFSLVTDQTPTANTVHASSSGAIPQNVWCRVVGTTSLTKAEIEGYCSESNSSNEGDNVVFANVVVIGRT
jgi:hypothetical protein